MSRWLKSVNNLLDNLDGQVESAVEDEDPDVAHASRGAIGNVLSRRGLMQNEYFDDDDDDDVDSDDYEEQGEEEWMDSEDYEEEEHDEDEVIDFQQASTPTIVATEEPTASPNDEEAQSDQVPLVEGALDGMAEVPIETTVVETPRPPPMYPPTANHASHIKDRSSSVSTSSSPESAVKVERPSEFEQSMADPAPKDVRVPDSLPISQSSASPVVDEQPRLHERSSRPPPPPISGLSRMTNESPPPSGQWSLPSSSNQQQQLKKTTKDLKKVQAEARQLRKHVLQLNSQLESSEAELTAQRGELERAAERLERDRHRHKEEREDLLDDQEEEVENLKEHYEKMLAEQKGRFEDQVGDLQNRLNVEENMRLQEGGDWTKELEDSLQRERDAIKTLQEVKDQHSTLISQVAKLETQQNALQSRLETATQNAQTAERRERDAEDKLDAAMSLHSRQLSQRQARETELERTVADLGSALAVSGQKESRGVAGDDAEAADASLKEQFVYAKEELETVKVQLSLETQRCEALRQELNEVSQERTDEMAVSQARQQHHDRQIADLNANVSRLQSTVRKLKNAGEDSALGTDEGGAPDSVRAARLTKELAQMKKQVDSLSDQLIRRQASTESSKSEIFALKNRLQSATTRAERAEQSLATASFAAPNVYQTEGGSTAAVPYGGSTVRRRVKGGQRSSSTSVQSIRSALNLNPGRVSGGTEQVAATIDAVDGLFVEIGGFMRHEPLARLGLMLYLTILHLWAFCLILFHAHSFEEEHADFGSLSDPNHPRPGP